MSRTRIFYKRIHCVRTWKLSNLTQETTEKMKLLHWLSSKASLKHRHLEYAIPFDSFPFLLLLGRLFQLDWSVFRKRLITSTYTNIYIYPCIHIYNMIYIYPTIFWAIDKTFLALATMRLARRNDRSASPPPTASWSTKTLRPDGSAQIGEQKKNFQLCLIFWSWFDQFW